jgi:uncharacterized protein YdeI (YjbR/CyaY-like superfamily)
MTEPHDVQFFATASELQAWFDENHAMAGEVWIGYYKKSSRRPSVTWSEAVDEALCVGWIDGVVRRLDDVSHVQRFTPRRKGSTWSAFNVARIAVLMSQGRMRPAGTRAFEARTVARTGIYPYERPVQALTDEELELFQADPDTWDDWESRPPSYRKAALHWVASARQVSTRERRIAALIEEARTGRPIKPLAWIRKSA